MINWVITNWYLLIAGLIVSILIDYLGWKRAGWNKYEKGLEFFEHYHWGLVLWILANLLSNFLDKGSPFIVGIGSWLIVAEFFQKRPFACKSRHWKSSTLIGLLFVGALFFVYYFNLKLV